MNVDPDIFHHDNLFQCFIFKRSDVFVFIFYIEDVLKEVVLFENWFVLVVVSASDTF